MSDYTDSSGQLCKSCLRRRSKKTQTALMYSCFFQSTQLIIALKHSVRFEPSFFTFQISGQYNSLARQKVHQKSLKFSYIYIQFQQFYNFQHSYTGSLVKPTSRSLSSIPDLSMNLKIHLLDTHLILALEYISGMCVFFSRHQQLKNWKIAHGGSKELILREQTLQHQTTPTSLGHLC